MEALMNIKEMTLKEKIGQMLCLSFHGTEYNDQLRNLIEKHNIGTIIHFARNIVDLKQIYELNQQIHKHSKYPVFVGLDHEGGMVRRVMNDITYLPGAMALGNATEEEMYKIYNQVGKELRNLGYNMNYMPSVDVNNNPYNPQGDKEYTEDFLDFWHLYPKQRAGSKEKAFKAYIKALKEKRTTKEQLHAAVRRYAFSDEVLRGFAKGCAAWLNDDRFNTTYTQERENKWKEF